MADNDEPSAPPDEHSQRSAALHAALRQGPRGALFVSVISVALLFVGWLAFYYFVFLPRGPVG
jgi:hypothetical protein